MSRLTTIIAAVIFALVLAVVVVAAVLNAASSPNVKTHLGSSVFVVGKAKNLAKTVEDEGPLLFADAAGHQRDVFVQHLGTTWSAFDAHPAGRQCVLQYRARTRDFLDPCTNRTYAGDGAGLTHYRTSIDDNGRLVVDLRTAL